MICLTSPLQRSIIKISGNWEHIASWSWCLSLLFCCILSSFFFASFVILLLSTTWLFSSYILMVSVSPFISSRYCIQGFCPSKPPILNKKSCRTRLCLKIYFKLQIKLDVLANSVCQPFLTTFHWLLFINYFVLQSCKKWVLRVLRNLIFLKDFPPNLSSFPPKFYLWTCKLEVILKIPFSQPVNDANDVNIM